MSCCPRPKKIPLFALKFSGTASEAQDVPTKTALADGGVGGGTNPLLIYPHYPVAAAFKTETLSVNLLTPIAADGSVVVRLLRNGIAVPGMFVTYGGPVLSGILSIDGVALFAKGQTYDVEVEILTPTIENLSVSATLAARAA